MINPADKRPPTYAVRHFTIPAGASVETYRAADFLTCLGATAGFKLSFDNAPRVDFEAGLTLRTAGGFTRLEMINEGASDISITLGFGRGDIQDSRLTLGGTIGADNIAPENFAAGAPVSALNAAAKLIAAANANRREIVLVNAGAATVYIGGDAGAVAGAGLPLAGGQSLALTTSAAIYARNDTGAAVAVHAGEMGV